MEQTLQVPLQMVETQGSENFAQAVDLNLTLVLVSVVIVVLKSELEFARHFHENKNVILNLRCLNS